MEPDDIPQGGTSKWNVGVRQYPIFAEYAEPVLTNGSSGISDTGLTLRAFLPIDSQGNRSSVHKYIGSATVVDSRVVCIQPNITISGVEMTEYGKSTGSASLSVLGNVSVPIDLQEEATSSRVRLMPSRKYNCSTSPIISASDVSHKYHPKDWDLSVCQLGHASGYLEDAWTRMERNNEEILDDGTSRAYLLVNFSRTPADVHVTTSDGKLGMLERIFNGTYTAVQNPDRGDWTDVYLTGHGNPADRGILSFSLCLPALETRYMNVLASSPAPLAQPRYRFESGDRRVRFDDVRKQMLSSQFNTAEQRGILSLQPQTWENASLQNPPYLGKLDLSNALVINPYEDQGNATANLLQPYERPTGHADISVGGLPLEILRKGGTTAEALQSMLTALLASRYQDYVFEGEGSSKGSASRADFVMVQIPGGMVRAANGAAGATRSYTLVMTAIAVHVFIVTVVVIWFCKGKHV